MNLDGYKSHPTLDSSIIQEDKPIKEKRFVNNSHLRTFDQVVEKLRNGFQVPSCISWINSYMKDYLTPQLLIESGIGGNILDHIFDDDVTHTFQSMALSILVHISSGELAEGDNLASSSSLSTLMKLLTVVSDSKKSDIFMILNNLCCDSSVADSVVHFISLPENVQILILPPRESNNNVAAHYEQVFEIFSISIERLSNLRPLIWVVPVILNVLDNHSIEVCHYSALKTLDRLFRDDEIVSFSIESGAEMVIYRQIVRYLDHRQQFCFGIVIRFSELSGSFTLFQSLECIENIIYSMFSDSIEVRTSASALYIHMAPVAFSLFVEGGLFTLLRDRVLADNISLNSVVITSLFQTVHYFDDTIIDYVFFGDASSTLWSCLSAMDEDVVQGILMKLTHLTATNNRFAAKMSERMFIKDVIIEISENYPLATEVLQNLSDNSPTTIT